MPTSLGIMPIRRRLVARGWLTLGSPDGGASDWPPQPTMLRMVKPKRSRRVNAAIGWSPPQGAQARSGQGWWCARFVRFLSQNRLPLPVGKRPPHPLERPEPEVAQPHRAHGKQYRPHDEDHKQELPAHQVVKEPKPIAIKQGGAE